MTNLHRFSLFFFCAVQGVTFACLNHLEGGGGEAAGEAKLATYAVRIKAADVLERFCAAVEEHRRKGGPEQQV